MPANYRLFFTWCKTHFLTDQIRSVIVQLRALTR
jgi:hypothetical protein